MPFLQCPSHLHFVLIVGTQNEHIVLFDTSLNRNRINSSSLIALMRSALVRTFVSLSVGVILSPTLLSVANVTPLAIRWSVTISLAEADHPMPGVLPSNSINFSLIVFSLSPSTAPESTPERMQDIVSTFTALLDINAHHQSVSICHAMAATATMFHCPSSAS